MIPALHPARSDRWQSLIHASEHIAFATDRKEPYPSPPATLVALEQIRSLKEIFGPALDPARDFEAYAVRQLLKSLEAALSRG